MWIIDFEASGLSKKSYPIEVGITNGTNNYSAIIKPMLHWNYWEKEAELVHNIPRSELENNGILAEIVTADLNNLVGNDTVYCDCVNWDGFWLNVLFSDNAIQPKFEILDIRTLLLDNYEKIAKYESNRTKLEASGLFQSHRALDDATMIHRALQDIF